MEALRVRRWKGGDRTQPSADEFPPFVRNQSTVCKRKRPIVGYGRGLNQNVSSGHRKTTLVRDIPFSSSYSNIICLIVYKVSD